MLVDEFPFSEVQSSKLWRVLFGLLPFDPSIFRWSSQGPLSSDGVEADLGVPGRASSVGLVRKPHRTSLVVVLSRISRSQNFFSFNP